MDISRKRRQINSKLKKSVNTQESAKKHQKTTFTQKFSTLNISIVTGSIPLRQTLGMKGQIRCAILDTVLH